MKNRGGRPRKYTKEFLADLAAQFEVYIEETDLPIIAEFASQHKIPRQTLYDNEEFTELLRICIDKKEAALERGGLSGDYQPTMAVFSLKQLGWRDKQEIEHSGGMDIQKRLEQMSDEELNALAGELGLEK